MIYSLTALAALVLSNGYTFYLLRKKDRFHKKIHDAWRHEKQSLNSNIIKLMTDYGNLERELKHIKRGWWPAEPTNCNNRSRFAYGGGEEISNPVKFITQVGVVFKGSTGFIEWHNLLVYVGKIK